MGKFLSKFLHCTCPLTNATCNAKSHYCICKELYKCRHGEVKFGRCREKSRVCFDFYGKLILCLASNHHKNYVQNELYCESGL